MKALHILIGILVGCLLGFVLLYTVPYFKDKDSRALISPSSSLPSSKGEVIGFLPYALLTRASTHYEKYLTEIAYFGLTIDSDGTILKLNNPQEKEPGWYALESGKVTPFLTEANNNNVALSLVVFKGDNNAIDTLISNPIVHAKNLAHDVVPLMQQYGFTDLNLDIESTKTASPAAQKNFIQFAATLKNELTAAKTGTLTVDVSTLDVLNHELIQPQEVAKIADRIILMAYDYHSSASSVTGAVAPLGGAGVDAEYDVTSALQKTLVGIPRYKIILGLPVYGYEWETLGREPRTAIIPGAGGTLSNKRAEDLLATCATCSATFDVTTQEASIVYQNTVTGVYHQLFYPTKESTLAKIKLAQEQELGGLALWAMGYEGSSILTPLAEYRQ